jgi:hypothetical protein
MLSPNLWHLVGKILKKDMAHRMPAEVSPLLTVMYELLNLNICHDTFWKPDVEEEVQHYSVICEPGKRLGFCSAQGHCLSHITWQ